MGSKGAPLANQDPWADFPEAPDDFNMDAFSNAINAPDNQAAPTHQGPRLTPVEYDPFHDVGTGPSSPMPATPGNLESLPVVTDDGSTWAQPRPNSYDRFDPKKVSGAILPFSAYPDGSVSLDPEAGIAGQVKSAFTLPYDVATGRLRLDPNSQAAIGRAAGAAALATPGDMIAPGAGSGALAAREVAVPTKEELYAAGGSQIRAANNMQGHLWPQAVSELSNLAAASLKRDNLYDINAPTTHALLNRLGNTDPSVSVPLAELNAYRGKFSDMAKELAGTQDGLASRRVVSILDGFMENPPPEAVLAGPVAEQAELYRLGRGNWSAAQRSNKVQGIEYNAEVQSENPRGSTYDSALRRKVQPLLNPQYPERLYGFSAPERQGVQDVANGTTLRNSLGTAGEWMGGKGRWQSIIPSMVAGEYGSHQFGPVGWAAAAGPPVVGTALRAAESKLANNAFNRLDTVIRKRSPLYEQRVRGTTPSLPNSDRTVGAARIGAAGAVNQPSDQAPQYAKGGEVKKPTHEFLVERLMALAEKAKREEKKRTEPILNMPDDTVTAALAKAQEAI